MQADSGIAVLLTQDSLRDALPHADGVAVVSMDGDRAAIEAQGADAIDGGAGPDTLAYVIYTSGSTGTPKGAGVAHRSVVRLVRGANFAKLDAEQVVLQAAPVAFDASTLELWGPLLNGGRLVLMPGVNPSLAELGAALTRHGVTTLWLTSGLFQVMVDERLDDLRTVRQLLAGGDVLPVEQVIKVQARFPACQVINGYGPTENTTFTTCYPVPAGWTGGAIPIGAPISNTTVYVVDAALRPVPVGVAGELYTGGEGVARGYLGRPAMTAERFVPDPFGKPGSRMYRTGDRVRWNAQGVVEYLGRIDQQVKVRGFRIELGEIETRIRQHADVRECVVVAREDAPGDKRLVAYVVGHADAEALRAHVRETLPDYMTPAAFVSLEALPLNPNGKVDRRALPAPEYVGAEDAFVAPRTPAEEVLAGIWAEVLRVERVGARDSFFDLGGHSLLATRVVSRIREVFGAELPLRALFEGPTVAELAERVEQARGTGAAALPPVLPVERTDAMPLSFAQERLWFLDRMQPEGHVYNMPWARRLSGALDAAALERAFGEMVRRHESLRTVFAEVDGRPVQVISPFTGFTLAVTDLSAMEPAAREAEARRRATEDAATPFDLAAGPLFRASLLRLADDEHVLLMNMHHVVSDGWSMGVIFRELGALYGAFTAGEASPLPELAVQYADFAAWQRTQLQGAALDGQIAFWKDALGGAPALLELPTDRPRPAVQSYRGAVERVRMPRPLLDRLEALARAEGATTYMVMLAAWQVLLGKYAGTDDVVVGSPIAGRTRRELEPLIGFFVNTLVLRADLSGDPAFREVLRRVRRATLGAYDHQDVPFERLVEELQPERSTSHSPLFQVMFSLRPSEGGAGAGLPGLRMGGVEAELSTTKFDLMLGLETGDAGIHGAMEFSTDLFDRATIRRMIGHLERLLDQVAADADAPLSALELVDAAERDQVVHGWNRTAVHYPREASVGRLFAQQAARTPHAVAVVHEDETLTYAELDARSNRVARHLLSLGVRGEARVGICMERGLEMVAAVLGILKAGAAYVPLDPAYPAERLELMLADSGVGVLLTQDSLRGQLPARHGVAVVSMDGDRAAIAARGAEPVDGGAGADSLAYVIYTSGSTGTPKGAGVQHRSIVRLVRGANYVRLDENEVVLQAAPVSFDASTLELWGPLLNGGRLVLMPGIKPSLEEIGATIARHGVTTVWLTAGLFQVMVDERLDDLAGVRQLLAGGDVLPVETVMKVQARFPGCQVINGYGPTENTTFTCCYPVPAGWSGGPIPIGAPISSTTVYVLDGALRPVPVGVRGELFTGGDGVARGYLGHPALTAERFVPDPFGGVPGARMYRTGDRVRWNAGGVVEYLGRLDTQVKIRGFRIEPGEVEATLRRHPGVAECAVITREDVPGDRRLVAYVTGGTAADALRAHLRETLPEYMLPAAFVAMDALPLNPNGKLDRRALPAPEYGGGPALLPPRNALEEKVAEVWSSVLGVPAIGVHDNFFDLGGTSLLLYRVYSRLKELKADLRVVDLFRYTTVEAVAEHLDAGAAPENDLLAASRARAEERRALRGARRGR
jgi:amino acid adenylation domain-containing protein